MKKNQKRVRFIAVVLTMLMLLGLSGTSATASDLPSEGTLGKITVHKYSTAAESLTPGTGLELGEGDAAKLGTPMPNVGFTLYAVNEELEVTAATTAAEAKVTATEISAEVTDQYGIAAWKDLKIGYYVLSETTPPPGTDYATSPDVIITMPMGITTTGTGWNYDIHVYPKNVKTAALSKEVLGTTKLYNFGDTVSWKIDSKIEDLLKDESTYGSYKVSDPLDDRLTYVDTSDIVLATGGTTSPITLQRVDDYTVQTTAENTVVWALTNEGMDKLAAAGSLALSIQFETTVNDKAIVNVQNASEFDLTNGARVDWKDLSGNEKSIATDPEAEPSITFGGLILNKVDSLDDEILLDGAVFKIATTEEDAKEGNYIKNALSGEDIVITTGDKPGTVGVESGWAMVTALAMNTEGVTKYYLVETKAPDGYVLRQNILEITIPAGDKIATADIVNQKIGNPPIPGDDTPIFVLPTTGGIGTTLFIVIGVAMMAVASYMMIVATRRKREIEQGDNIAG